MQRRDFLNDIAMYSAFCAGVPNAWRVTSRPTLADDPFTLGVGSGDPTSSGAIIWTRLAPKFLEPDGGMDGQRTAVNWEVAEDEQFARVVQRGRATAAPELGYSLHIDVPGLASDRWYFYRFTLPAGASPVGRVRTTPAAGAVTPFKFGVASCQQYETGYFTAYDHLAREGQLDLVTHLGDYIYEYAGVDGRVRKYATTEIRTLDQYRARYAQTKSDKALQAAHARAPWIVTWDDHEVDNNYAGSVGENGMESEEQIRVRRAAGYQAWWENQPVRVPRVRSWADLNITRTMQWGALAKFHVLDTRQYRSDQPCADGNKEVPCGTWGSQEHTVLGQAQEQWLDSGLAASKARWQVLAQQIRVAPYDNKPGDGSAYSMDQWSGYPAAVDRLMKSIAQRAPNRTVALTGDIHSNWVNELRTRYDRPEAPKIGAEFVGTSITSGGDGSEVQQTWEATKVGNPQCLWHNNHRGYVMHAVDPDGWRASYRTVPFVSKPDAPVKTAAEFVVANGSPGIQKV